MNREILFKAKRIDNSEWVYGIPMTHKGVWWMHTDEGLTLTINPDTICQYTGINTDRKINPQKVFEGDIIHIGEKGVKYYVMPLGTFYQNDMAIQGYYVSDGSNLLDWQVGLEIIGNIHD